MNAQLKTLHQVDNFESKFLSDDESASQILQLNDAGLTVARLQGSSEIKQVLHLRQQIDLTAAAMADPLFWDHEKKEMR